MSRTKLTNRNRKAKFTNLDQFAHQRRRLITEQGYGIWAAARKIEESSTPRG